MYQDDITALTKQKKLLNSELMGDFVDIGDWKLHYYEVGEGEDLPLLLIHGIGQSLYTWHKVIDELSKERRVIALDLPGLGYSSHPLDAKYDIDSIAELIVRFMDMTSIKVCNAIGFSTGAIYLLRAAELHPKRFGRLVIETPGGLTPEMPFFIRALRSPISSWLYKILISPRSIESILNECFFDQTQINQEMVQQTFLPLKTSEDRTALVAHMQQFEEEDTMQNLRNIEHECLLLWGVDDRWHDVEMGDRFHIMLKHSRLINIRNCGHVIHEEKIDRFMESVEEFLSAGLLKQEDQAGEGSDSYFFG